MKINTEAGRLICETAAAYGWSQETGVYALARAANSLAAADAEYHGAHAAGIRAGPENN